MRDCDGLANIAPKEGRGTGRGPQRGGLRAAGQLGGRGRSIAVRGRLIGPTALRFGWQASTSSGTDAITATSTGEK